MTSGVDSRNIGDRFVVSSVVLFTCFGLSVVSHVVKVIRLGTTIICHGKVVFVPEFKRTRLLNKVELRGLDHDITFGRHKVYNNMNFVSMLQGTFK